MAPPSMAFTTPYLKGGLRVVASRVSSSYKALELVLDLEQAGEASTNHVSEFVGLYVQQKCSLSNHITGVKEHSVHLNESTADKTTGRLTATLCHLQDHLQDGRVR